MEKTDPDIRSRRSITRDLTLGLLLVVFIVSVCIVILSYLIFTKRIEQEFRNKADEYITHLTKTLEIPLWNFNEESLHKIAHDYFETEYVTKLRIVDSMNNVLFEHVGPDIIDRIFDPYFTTKNVVEGSGIGLSLVHAIVKNHNGVIAVDSKPGKGTNFYIFYPIIENKVTRESEIQRPLPRGNERILVVDDEMAIITVVKRNLENLDYKIRAETDPVKALELFKNDPEGFDLIITDMTMPRITGEKLAEEARNIRPDIPIILCTGYSDRINQLKTKSTENMEFLTKPIEKGEMTRTIRKLLDK